MKIVNGKWLDENGCWHIVPGKNYFGYRLKPLFYIKILKIMNKMTLTITEFHQKLVKLVIVYDGHGITICQLIERSDEIAVFLKNKN